MLVTVKAVEKCRNARRKDWMLRGAGSLVGKQLMRICFLAAIPSLTFVMASLGQEHTSEDVLTLDRAIELARANNRAANLAKIDIDMQREAWAEVKTQYYPRFDTY